MTLTIATLICHQLTAARRDKMASTVTQSLEIGIGLPFSVTDVIPISVLYSVSSILYDLRNVTIVIFV